MCWHWGVLVIPFTTNAVTVLVRTLSWIFLRERIHEWVGNARSSFKTCIRVLVLLLLVGAGVCSDVTNLHGLARPWSGDDVKFRGDGSLCLYSNQLMTVTERFLLSVLHHVGAWAASPPRGDVQRHLLDDPTGCCPVFLLDRSLRCILFFSSVFFLPSLSSNLAEREVERKILMN